MRWKGETELVSYQFISGLMPPYDQFLKDSVFILNLRWTEGLISAAKAVGLGANLLVDAADRWTKYWALRLQIYIFWPQKNFRIVLGSGKFEEIMVASQEIAASTAQLVIASRVKAKEGSSKFQELKVASKVVTEATGAVVGVAKSSAVTVESK